MKLISGGANSQSDFVSNGPPEKRFKYIKRELENLAGGFCAGGVDQLVAYQRLVERGVQLCREYPQLLDHKTFYAYVESITRQLYPAVGLLAENPCQLSGMEKILDSCMSEIQKLHDIS